MSDPYLTAKRQTYSPGNIFRTGIVLERNDSFGNRFTSIGSDNMHTQNLVRLLFAEEFHKPIGVVYSLCSRVGEVREFTDFVFHTGFL